MYIFFTMAKNRCNLFPFFAAQLLINSCSSLFFLGAPFLDVFFFLEGPFLNGFVERGGLTRRLAPPCHLRRIFTAPWCPPASVVRLLFQSFCFTVLWLLLGPLKGLIECMKIEFSVYFSFRSSCSFRFFLRQSSKTEEPRRSLVFSACKRNHQRQQREQHSYHNFTSKYCFCFDGM